MPTETDRVSAISSPSSNDNESSTRRRNIVASTYQKASAPISNHGHPTTPKWFQSRKIKRGSVERPWMDIKDPREKWVTIIPIIGMIVGVALAGLLIWDGLRHVVNHEYCLVLNEDWSSGFNQKIWMREAEVGGFGYVSSVKVDSC